MRPVVFLLALLATLPAWGEWHTRSRDGMGTRLHAEVFSTDAARAVDALDAVMAEMDRIEAQMSPWIASSALSRINREAASGWVPVPGDLFAVLEAAQAMSRRSDGAFDITFASAGRYYDYRAGKRPDADELAAAVAAINWRYVELDAPTTSVHFAHPGVYVDLGGIAKGYAVDRCTALLRARGFQDAMVSAGGDSRMIGDRHGRPWMVGVRDPRHDGAMAVVLPLADTAVSTSGDYERYFVEDGVRYHHILDPKTGDSARKVQSVSIIGPNATLTDALSTTVFVLGVEAGLALVNRTPEVDAVIIDGSGALHYSEGLMPGSGEVAAQR